jgi:hypothetical protein
MTIEGLAAGWNLQRVTAQPGAMLGEEFLVSLGIWNRSNLNAEKSTDCCHWRII